MIPLKKTRDPLVVARSIANAFANAQAGRPHSEAQARDYALEAKNGLLGPNGSTIAEMNAFADLVVNLLPLPGTARRVSGRDATVVCIYSPSEAQKRLPLGGGQRGPWMTVKLTSGVLVNVPTEFPEELLAS